MIFTPSINISKLQHRINYSDIAVKTTMELARFP